MSDSEPKQIKKYSFKLLRDQADNKDRSKDQTHERAANSILKLLKDENGGISIGLEGSWGTGKSTIISILRKKLFEENLSIPLIQFDSWAHEGDPLRRIFLESLINEILDQHIKEPERKKLDKLLKKISNREKETKIKTKHTTTWLGKFMTISVFLIPIGTSILSDVDFNLLSLSGEPYSLFWCGLIPAIAPFLVISGNLFFRILRKIFFREEICNLKNWAFLQSNADQTSTQEISEEEERSSIEFEKYFKDIIKLIFADSVIQKLIIVIDNLDRIDTQNSLKIWSTLQTFLQQRNQPGNDKDWFKKIWIIVPYDQDGLAALWDKNSSTENKKENGIEKNENTHENGKERKLSKSFFDKCFQLRIEVPKPIFDGWENFANNMMNDAIPSWDQKDKNELIRILRMTRKSLNDIPTPREIKNYINQVGFLASQWGNEMAIGSISYYVCLRELEHKSVDDIREMLVNQELKKISYFDSLPHTCTEDLAGLVFGVSPGRGKQLLLEPEISKALKNSNENKLRELCQNHDEGFWSIFNYHFANWNIDLEYVLTSAKAIYNGLWKDHSQRCKEFNKKVSIVDLKTSLNESNWPEEKIENYLCLMEICKVDTSFIKELYDFLIKSLNYTINEKKDKDWQIILEGLQKIIKKVSEIDTAPFRQTLPGLTLQNFLQIARTSIDKNLDMFKYLAPPETITKEIAGGINAGQIIPEGFPEAINYSIDATIVKGWETVLDKCQQYFIWKNGNYSNQSDEIFNIINILAFRIDNSFEKMKQIAQSAPFYNLYFSKKAHRRIEASLFCGFILSSELHQLNIQNTHEIPHALNEYNEIKNFWKTPNQDNAKKILIEIKEYKIWSFIWDLAKESQNKLVGDIINQTFDDPNTSEFFKVKDCLLKIKDYSSLITANDEGKNNDKIKSLVNKFIENSLLVDEIITNEELDVDNYAYELYFITNQVSEKKLIDKIEGFLNALGKDIWSNAFTNNPSLTALAVRIKEKKASFYLENDYFDALIEFIKNSDSNEEMLSEWQKSNWPKLISLMNESFQTHYCIQVTEYLCEKYFNVSSSFYTINKSYFIFPDINHVNKVIRNNLEKFLEDGDFERLNWLDSILSKGNFKPEEHIPGIVKNPFNKLYNAQDGNSDNKFLLKKLAKKFKIPISETKSDNEDDAKNETE